MLHRLTAACASGAGRDCSYNLAGNRRRPEAESVAKNWIFGNHPTRSWKNHSCRSPGAWTHRRHSGLNPRPPIAANRKSDRVARGPPANLEPPTSNSSASGLSSKPVKSQPRGPSPRSTGRASPERARPDTIADLRGTTNHGSRRRQSWPYRDRFRH